MFFDQSCSLSQCALSLSKNPIATLSNITHLYATQKPNKKTPAVKNIDLQSGISRYLQLHYAPAEGGSYSFCRADQ